MSEQEKKRASVREKNKSASVIEEKQSASVRARRAEHALKSSTFVHKDLQSLEIE